jgi:uncharacterized membrane protein
MTAAKPTSDIGRHVFGVAALCLGLITLVWPDYSDYDSLHVFLNAGNGPIFAYVAAAAQIVGGVAIQFGRTAKTGAVVLGVVYLILAFIFVPQIVATPLVFDPWGNFFEQFSLVTGALLVYAHLSSAWAPATLNRVARILFGICAASFAVYQAVHPDYTATLVPKWLPPSQIFWTWVTTVLFGLAALALLVNRVAVLATHLLTLMLVMLGLLVWVPAIFADRHSHSNWSECFLTFAIAGAAWIVADLLAENRRRKN